jgi:hypothetical protein
MDVQFKIKKLCEDVLEFYAEVVPEEQRESCATLIDLTNDILSLTIQQLGSLSAGGHGISDWHA